MVNENPEEVDPKEGDAGKSKTENLQKVDAKVPNNLADLVQGREREDLQWTSDLGKIPKPKPASKTPDQSTREGLDKAEEDADIRQHPIVAIILIAIGFIGLLLVGTAVSLDYAVDCAIPDVAAEANEEIGWGIERLGSAEDAILGLGVELSASASMLYFFFYKLKNSDGQWGPVKLIFIAAISGFVFAVAPQFMAHRCPLLSSVMISFGVEIFGAVVIFAVLDNVMEALADRGSGS